MEDFGEVFKRYIPRSELESLLAESRAAEEHRSEVKEQNPEAGVAPNDQGGETGGGDNEKAA